MKTENIEEVRGLISCRDKLVSVIEKSERWNDAHFEFTEHYGDYPGRVKIPQVGELKNKMLDAIREEIKHIDSRLEEM